MCVSVVVVGPGLVFMENVTHPVFVRSFCPMNASAGVFLSFTDTLKVGRYIRWKVYNISSVVPSPHALSRARLYVFHLSI